MTTELSKVVEQEAKLHEMELRKVVRRKFARAALTGLLARPHAVSLPASIDPERHKQYDWIATTAWEIAEAMVRNEPPVGER